MVTSDTKPEPIIVSEDQARGAGTKHTLLPMLISGLVLITVGMLVVMYFV